MRVHLLVCGPYEGSLPTGISTHQLSVIPSRRELALLNDLTRSVLPNDPTPSLDEIARQPNVAHLCEPQLAPQRQYLDEGLRLIIVGCDAAASAILTRLMRIDALWTEVAIIPQHPSPTATNWNLGDTPWDVALNGEVHPMPLIRDDAGIAVSGSATVTSWDGSELYGEIIVDSHTVCTGLEEGRRRKTGIYGAKLVPMLTAPGLVAVPYVTSLEPRTGFLGFPDRSPRGAVDSSKLITGRALQAGGKNLKVTIDTVSRKRPVERVTFYRHLRDLQAVRPR